MPKVWLTIKHNRREAGFSPIEILLAATVFGFLVTALIGGIVYGRAGTAGAGDRSRAIAIAEEGVEAVRNIRDAAFANLTNGTFGLVQSSNTWTLSGASDVTGIYTRAVTIATVDTVRKTVTSTVTWNGGQVSVATRLSNWIASIKNWAAAIVGGGADIASTQDGLKVATAGNFAYVIRSTGTPNFSVYNISNPAAPTAIGSLTLAGTPTNIAVSGNFVYVSNALDTAELQTVNVTTPASPVLSSSYNAIGTGDGSGVFAVGTRIYLTRLSDATANAFEMTIINAATPTAPVLLGGYNNNINMREVVVIGTVAYVASEADTQELLDINVTTPASPVLLGALDLTGTNNATTIDGFGTSVLIGQSAIMYRVNVTTPASPAVLNSVTTTGAALINDVTVDSSLNYAFLGTANTTSEFQVANISSTVSTTIVRVVDMTGTTSTLNGVAYNSTVDVVVGSSASDTQEIITFIKN